MLRSVVLPRLESGKSARHPTRLPEERPSSLSATDLACRVDVETRMGISGLKSIIPYFARMNIHLPATSSCSPRVGFD